MTDTAKGYLWAELDVLDAARFEDEYSVFVRPLLARYGAKFLIVDEHPLVLEGDRAVRKVVLVEFDSPATARRFYDDPAYQAIVVARNRWSRGHVYLVAGT
ncbi:MAG: DUF1330 domain-containing protein [Burkholderiaceae bacterium]